MFFFIVAYILHFFFKGHILLFRGKKRVVEKRERKKNITLSLYLEKGMRLKYKGKIPVLTVTDFNKTVRDDFFSFNPSGIFQIFYKE